MHSSNPVKRQSASDYAYNELRTKIIELEYPPSEQLAEDSLAKGLNISRTPLRQALYRLELEGLVSKQPNGRLRVCPISLAEAKEVFKVREALEGLLTAEAAQLVTPENLHQLEDRIELMKLAAVKGRKTDTVKYGSEFHSILHAISTNATAKRFWISLKAGLNGIAESADTKILTINRLYLSMNTWTFLMPLKKKTAFWQKPPCVPTLNEAYVPLKKRWNVHTNPPNSQCHSHSTFLTQKLKNE
ncbi:GntR family transcriptional regulator [Bacillus licheniformis]